MKSETLRILVADDHTIVRNGIMKSLSDNFNAIEFAEASNSSEIMQHIHDAKWDLVTLDINMPGRNGMDVLKDIKEIHPEIPVIIFSMYPEDQFAVRAIKAGASAYLTKDISSKKLSEALKKILSGGTYLTSSIAELITCELRGSHDKPAHEMLSDREYQVFLLIASGLSVSSIAIELSLSVKTISVYRSNILTKMSLKNNSEMTHYAFKNNLVE
ncbi:MAG: response regulator transcription factor [Paludibacter sp.]|nr:response regulator transcription factor [Paludibacter sp.]